MKKNMGNVVEKGMNTLALKLVKKSVHSTCIWAVHQPKLPEEVKRIMK